MERESEFLYRRREKVILEDEEVYKKRLVGPKNLLAYLLNVSYGR